MIGFAEWLRIDEAPDLAGIIGPLTAAEIAAAGKRVNPGEIVAKLIKNKTLTDFQRDPKNVTVIDPKKLGVLVQGQIADSKKKSPGAVGTVGAAGTAGAAAK
jgi:hypothetical protein